MQDSKYSECGEKQHAGGAEEMKMSGLCAQTALHSPDAQFFTRKILNQQQPVAP